MKVFLRKIKKTAKIVNAVGGQMHHFFRAGPHFKGHHKNVNYVCFTRKFGRSLSQNLSQESQD